MKKIWMGLAAIALSVATITVGNVITGEAATTIPDNYGAYVVASSDSAESNGWTTYYTKIGDGNGIMTFDLLSTNTFGYFGLICGDAGSVSDIDSLKDYALFGKDVKTTLDLETQNTLDRKRQLLYKKDRTEEETAELERLENELQALGFSRTTRDPLYEKFIEKLYSCNV